MEDLSYIKLDDNNEYAFNYTFNYIDFHIAESIHKSMAEFRDLMILKFNAIGPYRDDIVFETIKDIQLAIDYLNPIIESYLIMDTLTGNFDLKKELI